MHFLAEYGLFLAKIVTWVIAILVTALGISLITQKNKKSSGRIHIRNLNQKFEKTACHLHQAIYNKATHKNYLKQRKVKYKEQEKHPHHDQQPNLFILEFHGDIKASATENLRREVDAILTVAQKHDKVLLRLHSGGGTVHGYGFGAAQCQRLSDFGLELIVAVDKVAASGGYLMAATADKIIAAPFALIGSIGVLLQLPNFHNFLKHHHIDFEMITAGQFKRTLTIFGENSDQGRTKMKHELEAIHHTFKAFIQLHRKNVDVERAATGEVWLASAAKELGLIDELITSDDFILKQRNHYRLLEIKYKSKKNWPSKLSEAGANIMISAWEAVLSRLSYEQHD